MTRHTATRRFHEAHLKAFASDRTGKAHGTFTVEEKAYAVLPDGVAFGETVSEVVIKSAVTVPYVNGVTVVARLHDGVGGDETTYGMAADGRLRKCIWVDPHRLRRGTESKSLGQRIRVDHDPLGGRLDRVLSQVDSVLSNPEEVAEILARHDDMGYDLAISTWASNFVSRQVGAVLFDLSNGCAAWETAVAPYFRLHVSGFAAGGERPTSARLVAVTHGNVPSDWTLAALSFGADEETAALAQMDLCLGLGPSCRSDVDNDRIEIVEPRPFFENRSFREHAAASLYQAAVCSPDLSPALRKAAGKAEMKPRNKALAAWPAFAEAWRAEAPAGIGKFLEASGWTLKLDPVAFLSDRFGCEPTPAGDLPPPKM